MRLGVHLHRFPRPRDGAGYAGELAATGTAAEAAGVSRLSVMDHYFQMEHNGGAEDPMLECYTALGFLAARTSTVRLGALVTGVTYRHPGLPAKIVTTLDSVCRCGIPGTTGPSRAGTTVCRRHSASHRL